MLEITTATFIATISNANFMRYFTTLLGDRLATFFADNKRQFWPLKNWYDLGCLFGTKHDHELVLSFGKIGRKELLCIYRDFLQSLHILSRGYGRVAYIWPAKSNGERMKYSYVIGNIIILLFQSLEYQLRTLFRSDIPGCRPVW
jgi:hypothetical protein